MDESVTTISALLQEFGTRLNELEEKQRLLKDRLLLIGSNLISSKEEFDKKDLEFRKKISEIDLEIKNLKQSNKRIIYELENLARKEEVTILQRQFKMFEPLQYAKVNDIRRLVAEEMNNIFKEQYEKNQKDKDIKNKDN